MGYKVFRSDEPDDGLPTNRASKRTLTVGVNEPLAWPKRRTETIMPDYHGFVDDNIMPLEWVSPWYKPGDWISEKITSFY